MKDIILKELDLIDNTISRLDRQIQTSKTICITLWTAWLGWFITQAMDKENTMHLSFIIMASALFPFLFWLIDYQYRKALLSTSKRQMLMSLFLNSKIREKQLEDSSKSNFPLFDPVGWLYNNNIETLIEDCPYDIQADKKRVLLKQKLSWSAVAFYKEAKWFYLPLIVISIILGCYFSC